MITQQQANYRRGDPINSCGSCVSFRGSGKNCAEVQGPISHYGMCDVYRADKNNPFGPTLSPQDVQTVKVIAARAAQRNQIAQTMTQGPPRQLGPPQ